MTRSISIVTGWPAPNVNMVCLTHVQEPSGFRRNDLHRSEVMTFRAEAESFVPLAFVPAVNLGRRCRCLHGREHLDYAIAVLGACRNKPGIAPVSARVRRRAASSPSLSRLVLHLGLACGCAYRVGKLVALALGTVWWFTTFGTPL